MKHIKLFETENDYKSNENLVYPHVCYTDDTKNVWVKRDNVKLITFTIDGTKQYTAEEGMTWGEWCNSEYNIGGFDLEGPGSSLLLCHNDCSDNFLISYMSKYIDVYENDLIIPNFNYEHQEFFENIGSSGCYCDF